MSFSLEITDYQVTRRDVLDVKRLGRDMTASFGRLALISFSPCSPTGREMFLTEQTVSFSSCVLYLPGCPSSFTAATQVINIQLVRERLSEWSLQCNTREPHRTREPVNPRARDSESSRARGSQKRAVTRAEYLIRYDNITNAISYVFVYFRLLEPRFFFSHTDFKKIFLTKS